MMTKAATLKHYAQALGAVATTGDAHEESFYPALLDLCRPFDTRHTYYTGRSRGFLCMPRPEIMRDMLQQNRALCVGRARQVVGGECWDLCFCSMSITDFNLFYRGSNLVLPLYVYPNGERDLFGAMEPSERRPNLHPKLLDALKEAHCRIVTALGLTNEIQRALDELYPAIELGP